MVKISQTPELDESPETGDLIPLVDTSDTTEAPSGTTKHVTVANFLTDVYSKAETDAAAASAAAAAAAAIVDASPATLDTLNELAAALGDDPNFATTITNLIAEKANRTITISQQSGDYGFVLSDAGTEVEGTSSSARTHTIPPNSSVAFPVGTVINVRQAGTGRITVAAGAGVTLRAPNGAKTYAQWSTVSIVKRATDEWVISGDVAT